MAHVALVMAVLSVEIGLRALAVRYTGYVTRPDSPGSVC